MRYFFLLFFLFVTQCVYSQSRYYKDVIVDRVTVHYPDYTVTAFIKPPKVFVPTEQEKNYFWYSANSIQVTQGGYSGKLLNGFYTSHFRNKNLKEQGIFNNGLKTGVWKVWNEEGKLQEVIAWKSGLQSGKFFRYDNKGAIKESGRYRGGKLNGKFTQYTPSDSVKKTRFKNGKTVTKTKNRVIPKVLIKPFKKKTKSDR